MARGGISIVRSDKRLSKLQLLRMFGATMSEIEKRRRGRPSPDSDPGYADREAAGLALAATIDFLRRLDMETKPFDRLNAALHDVAVHGRHAAMLVTPRRASRSPDSLSVQMVKGALAAIMKVRMVCGEGRDKASAWVARNIPPDLARKLARKPIKPETVADWYDRLNGEYGEKGSAHERWQTVLTVCDGMMQTRTLDDEKLKRMIESLSIIIPVIPRS